MKRAFFGRMFRLLAGGIIVLALVSCKRNTAIKPTQMPQETLFTNMPSNTEQGTAMTLSEKDDGQKIRVRTGQFIAITLQANPTTGYNWSVTALPNFVKAESEPNYQAGSNRLGGGGLWKLRLEVTGSGAGAVQVEYRRPFETDKGPIKVFMVNLEAD